MIPMDSEVWELGILAPGKGKGLGRTTRLDCPQMKVDPKVYLFEAYHSTKNNPNVFKQHVDFRPNSTCPQDRTPIHNTHSKGSALLYNANPIYVIIPTCTYSLGISNSRHVTIPSL